VGPRAADSDADASLIAQSLARPQIFAAIFNRHFDAVHGYLARRAGRDLADDLAAQTFTVAFERRASFRADLAETARPWLFGIATNLLRNEHRAERRALSILAELAVTAPAGYVDRTRLAHSELGSALASLDPGHRDALLLHAWEGFRYEEIAVALGVPVGTVRSRLARARARLRVALGAETPAGTDRSEVPR
jgi:RNA polymerase sigma factor (sigma-70 family)